MSIQVPRNALRQAKKHVKHHRIFSKQKRTRAVKSLQLRQFVKKWIKNNTTPSSNTKNVIKYKKNNTVQEHVVHWRTETFAVMYKRCRAAAATRFGVAGNFGSTFFFKQFPPYVKMRKKQDGLCPLHHTGISLRKEFEKKRGIWHRECVCQCVFCSHTGCNHGKNPSDGGVCSLFTCTKCKESDCPLDGSSQRTHWHRPVQIKRPGGGLYWTNELYTGRRIDLLETMQKEMEFFVEHDRHNIYHKDQMDQLLENFHENTIIIKADFIQNIVHGRGQETSQSYYGKRQTQFLCFVVWYKTRDDDGNVKLNKLYVDYLSSYLKHNSLYFQKCVLHLLNYLRQDMELDFSRV